MRAYLPSLLLLPAPAFAQSTPDMGSSLFQLVFGFALVLAMLFGALWLLKRLSSPRGLSASLLRIVAVTPLSPREKVVVLEIGEQWLVVGVAPGQISKLHEMPRDPSRSPSPSIATPMAPDFAEWLKRTLERRQGGGR